jgi:diphthamide biosynthesis protein 2
MTDLEQLCAALRLAKYERVAVQVHDEALESAPELIKLIQSQLPDSIVSLLGDSVTQCCLDEVSAEHYGSDCIVKLGHTCWFASQRIVAYFLPTSVDNSESLVTEYTRLRNEDQNSAMVVFPQTFQEVQELVRVALVFPGPTLVCLSPCMSYPGSGRVNWLNMTFSSKACLPISKRWYTSPDLRIAGRTVYRVDPRNLSTLSPVSDHTLVSSILDTESTKFLVSLPPSGSSSSLFTRLVNRFATSSDRVVGCPTGSATSNYKELLRRYKGVEAVKFANIVGIVVTHCSASRELFAVRDLLSSYLRSMGKEVHILSMGKLDGVKLGNFPEIDCFITMACPESIFFESDDLDAEWASAYEALVALELLDWSDHVITDYDEMLARMRTELPPCTPRTPRRRPDPSGGEVTMMFDTIPPARIEMGLRGIPSRYVSESGL